MDLFSITKISLAVTGYFSLEIFQLNNNRSYVEMLLFVVIFSTWTETTKLKAIGILALKSGGRLLLNKLAQYYFIVITAKFIDTTISSKMYEINGMSLSLYQIMFLLIILTEARNVIRNFEIIDIGANKTVLSSIARVISTFTRILRNISVSSLERAYKEERIVAEVEQLKREHLEGNK